jgi:replicative DNA helicase
MQQVAPDVSSSIAAEQSLLGALFVNNDVARVVSGIVRGEHFVEPFHGLIFDTACEMIAAGKAADPVTLGRKLPMENGSGLPTPVYLARLATEATTIINAPDYAEAIRDSWASRQIQALAEASISLALAPNSAPRSIISDMLGGLDQIRAEIDDQRLRRMDAGRCASEALERIRRIRAGEVEGGATTGLADLDRYIGGLKGGNLVVIAGRPGMGKSVLGSSLSRQSAAAGNGIGFFSLEMHDEQIAARMLADQAYSSRGPVSFKDIIEGRDLTEEQIDRLCRSQEQLEAMPLEIDLSSSLTVSDICARTRTLADHMRKRGTRLRAIVVDYLKFVRASERYRGQRVYEVGEITAGLKALAKDMDICVVLLAQLNRQVEARTDKRPELSDLRESGDIEADADVVMLLFREAYYLADKQDTDAQTRLLDCQNKLEIIIAKNRNGPTCTAEVFCDVASNAVRNLSRY